MLFQVILNLVKALEMVNNPVKKIMMEKKEKNFLIRIQKMVHLLKEIHSNLLIKMIVEKQEMVKLEFGPIMQDQEVCHLLVQSEHDIINLIHFIYIFITKHYKYICKYHFIFFVVNVAVVLEHKP